ncbi:MAG: serine--tRNA ligase [Thermaerobacter sp.]|nr:serine--tRNA ligase [Thermaerobacter sp.]
MLDMHILRHEPDRVRNGYRVKRVDPPWERVVELDRQHRELLQTLEAKKAERNRATEEVARRRRAKDPHADAIIGDMRRLGEEIRTLEAQHRPVAEELDRLVWELPNLPDPSVPEGAGESENREVAIWGTPRTDSQAVTPHWDQGVALGILDFERAQKLAGARFVVLKGFGAQLSRGLIQFMLTQAAGAGYEEVAPPLLALADTLYGSGQFPKFVEDVFRVSPHDLYLIPTAEVPLVNLRREEILDEDELPLHYTAHTASFRSEAGAAGRDTRGLIRRHQFDKVELVAVARPEDGLAELEAMRRQSAQLLEQLELPYRTVEHCGGDLGFGHAKSYDHEVWMPSYGRYVEISSVSLMGDFQARRAKMRWRRRGQHTTEFPVTLNGSALAVGRTMAAIMENHQTQDGGFRVPAVLGPFVGGRAAFP